MKGNKNDAMFDFQSDCLTSGPPEVVKHLTNLIRMFIVHGEVPYFLLVCTLLPLVKDNLGDTTSSDNYRAIASGSQILKLLDIVILLLEGEKLGCDSLQFGFQPKSSTSMCSWTLTSVISYYNHQGSSVYGCTMDLSKAFDLVEWLELFKILRIRKISPILLRLMLFVYSNQSCDVKWNGSYSHRFLVMNGVRQGAVSSPVLFSVYIDKLFKILRASGLGCRIAGMFYGCVGYADDLFLISASRSGLQAMVDICQQFAIKRKLKFSTNPNPSKSKTKCIMFPANKRFSCAPAPILLNGDPLPWVAEVKHLGNTLESDNSMTRDCSIKRAKFIGKLNSLSQEFHYVEPETYMKILNIYSTSFYGSGLWNIFGDNCERLYKAWNVSVRIAFNVDRTTHRYLIESISGSLHPKVMLASRFSKFHQSMKSSDKLCNRLLASLFEGDHRTVFGKTLSKIADHCDCAMEQLSPSLVKRRMRYHDPPDTEVWRLPIARELTSSRLKIPGFSNDELKKILHHICTT